jgi:hypothetical protein
VFLYDICFNLSNRNKWLLTHSQMTSAFSLRLMVSTVMNDVGNFFGGVGWLALDVVAGNVRDAGDF